jgi:putative methyltransferase (TIGR04325 family)
MRQYRLAGAGIRPERRPWERGGATEVYRVSRPKRLYPVHPLRALRARLQLITSIAAETRQYVLESRGMELGSRDMLLERLDSLAGQVEGLAEAQRSDRAWLQETLRVIHDRESERRQRLAALRASDSYDAVYAIDEPLVSVVIPTFRNHALLADRAIPSVLAQSYQHFEVIVVGDAAPATAQEAVVGFNDPRVSFHNLERRGPYPEEPRRRWLVAGVPPFNEAVRRARGEWIAPLDDDDAFRPDHIEVLLDAARRRRLELVYGGIAQHEPGGVCTQLGGFPPTLGQFNLQAALYRADLGDLFELELADELFDQPYDWALCHRMARTGVRMGMVDRIVVDYYPSSLWTRANDDDRDAGDSSAVEWSYVPEGWTRPHTHDDGSGWDVASVAQMYAARWPAFIEALDGTDPLGAVHVVPVGHSLPREDLVSHNMVMVFGYALAFSARNGGALSILDWGGALGHFHALARVLVPDLELDYHCKELSAVCEQGRRVSPAVTFHDNDDCLQRSYDLVLASGAIQYAEDWPGLFTRLGKAARRCLLITKVPVTDAPSFVVLQRAHRYGYNTQYLGWALNRGEIRTVAKSVGVELIREFFLSARLEVPDAPGSIHHAGFLFKAQQDARQ